MLSRILIPLDGSTASDAILLHVRPILERECASAVLLGVGGHGGEDSLADHLARQRELLEHGCVRAEAVLREGDPAREILAYAEEWNPSLIAMSTHGRMGGSPLHRRSVAEKVLRRTRHPLLLLNWNLIAQRARPKGAGFSPILVPLDGSARSARIVPLVEALAPVLGARVILQFVADVVGDEDPTPYEKAHLEPHRRRLAAAGVEAHSRVDADPLVQSILDAVVEEDAGLVAMATRRRSRLLPRLFGSTAEKVVHLCHSPVLLWPGR